MWRDSQVVRQWFAKPLFAGSIPARASRDVLGKWWNGIHEGLKILWSKDYEGSTPSLPIKDRLFMFSLRGLIAQLVRVLA